MDSNTKQSFFELGVSDTFAQALTAANYQHPSKIQAQAIPKLLDGCDVLGIAQTGTGKTAAFGLPIIQLLSEAGDPTEAHKPQALVLAPTRELAMQIQQELENFAVATRLRIAMVCGGMNINPQIRRMRQGVDVLIATPGRLLDLIDQKEVQLSQLKMLVLDEADRLLDMGFQRDVSRIIRSAPKRRPSLLFSATMPNAVSKLAADILHKPHRIEVAPKQMTVAKIEQRVAMVSAANKREVLEGLLYSPEVKKAIVFTRTKYGAEKLARKLRAAGISADAIHGNKTQNARNRTLTQFKEDDLWVLVATDIAARGIDIEGVTHVINYELPQEPENYVHRIGRTGRAGSTGIAWSLVDSGETKQLRAIERSIKKSIEVAQPPLGARGEQHAPVEKPSGEKASRQKAATDKDPSKNSNGQSRRPRKRRRRRVA